MDTPTRERCRKCGLPTTVDDYGLCNACYEVADQSELDSAHMETKHTPGPWESTRVDDNTGHWLAYEIGSAMNFGGQRIARTVGWTETACANARLLAAAPDLLAALKFIVNDAEPGEDAQLTRAGYNMACAAIARARG
mgnify:CR=1 FL=1